MKEWKLVEVQRQDVSAAVEQPNDTDMVEPPTPRLVERPPSDDHEKRDEVESRCSRREDDRGQSAQEHSDEGLDPLGDHRLLFRSAFDHPNSAAAADASPAGFLRVGSLRRRGGRSEELLADDEYNDGDDEEDHIRKDEAAE